VPGGKSQAKIGTLVERDRKQINLLTDNESRHKVAGKNPAKKRGSGQRRKANDLRLPSSSPKEQPAALAKKRYISAWRLCRKAKTRRRPGRSLEHLLKKVKIPYLQSLSAAVGHGALLLRLNHKKR